MKYVFFVILVLFFLPATGLTSDNNLESYIKNFDYDARIEMKTSSKKLIDLLEDGKAVLVDIRYKEEQ